MMPRHPTTDPRVEAVTASVAELVLRFGSVNAVADKLTAALGESRARIYPNRLQGLLSGDPTRGVNTATLQLLEEGVRAVESPNGWAISPDDVRAALAVANVIHDDPWAARRKVAEQFGIPDGAVGSYGLSVLPDSATTTSRIPTEPDWSWQDAAVGRSLDALGRRPSGRCGLIIPTGGGKTRIALRVALEWLTAHEGTVLWVTHRHHLKRQARRTLQELLRADDFTTEGAAALFDRVEFTLTQGLGAALEATEKPGDDPTLFIIDEAQHAVASSYQPLFDLEIPGLLLTATPNRTDALPIGIDEIAYEVTYRELFDRGCVVEPIFEPPEDMPDLDWSSPASIRNLADYLLQRTESDFAKPLVAVSQRDRAEMLYEAVVDLLDDRPSHPMSPDDVGYVHGERNSRSLDSASDFLDEFSAIPSGILIATSQLVGEGFDDPSIDAAVITYPSSSISHLMQVAGRALRWSRSKRDAHVVQVRGSSMEYHFEQRWLYQDISDALRPELHTVTFGSFDDLKDQLGTILVQHRVSDLVVRRIMAQAAAAGDEPINLMLSGYSFFGPQEQFMTGSSWNAILVTGTNRQQFRRVFNALSARTEDLKEQEKFLGELISDDQSSGGSYRSYAELVPATEYARREILNIDYAGSQSRPYKSGRATTWLRYISFEFVPTVPTALDELLSDAYNRSSVLSDYSAHPEKWSVAVRLELPVVGSECFLLDESAGRWFQDCRATALDAFALCERESAIEELARWRARLGATPVPVRFIDHFDQFLRPEKSAAHIVWLDSGRKEPRKGTDSRGLNANE